MFKGIAFQKQYPYLCFMNKYLLVSVILLHHILLNAQNNLVPNPGFEVHDSFCNAGYLDGTPPWINPTGGSPNFFIECCWNAGWAVPQNVTGYQYAHSGIGYGGFGIIDLTGLAPNFREYMQIRLYDSLKVNEKYLVKFFVSLSDSSQYATDDIGLYLSDSAINKNVFDHSPFINYAPQINNAGSNIIADKLNWTLIWGIYIANGGEQYITIGNFYDDSNTDTLFVGGSTNMIHKESYYYIDDVSVSLIEDSLPSENTISIPNAFTPNSDGRNDLFSIKGSNIKELHGMIFNRWGAELFNWSDVDNGWDGKYKGSYVSQGVYFYVIEVTYNDDTSEVKSGSVEVVR